MWAAANWRIKHELATTGKLSGTSIISDYSSYKVKLTELLKSQWLCMQHKIRFSVGRRLSTFSYSLSHQTPNFGFFPTSTAKIPSSSTPPQDVSGLIVVSNVCILCLIVCSLTHRMHMLIRLGIFNDFARLYISPAVM